MKLKNELEDYLKTIKNNRNMIIKYSNDLKKSGEYEVFENRLAYDVFRWYWTNKYNECSWSSCYYKYNCHDSHILTFARSGLKKTGII